MSVVACCLLFFVCISLNDHACSARLLGEENMFHLSNKNNGDEKKTSNLETLRDENKMKESSIFRELATEQMKDAGEVSDSAVQKGAAAGSYSWNVPRQKNSDKHPGFNLDYSPPKTHPPSHN